MKLLKSYKSLFLAVLLIIFAQWFMRSDQRVEHWYAQGVYPYVSGLMQFGLGWIPFSLGDLLYSAVIVWVGYRLWQLVSSIWRQGFRNWWAGNGSVFTPLLKLFNMFAWIWIAISYTVGFQLLQKKHS
jgi:hypothetical protein